jgi:tetratricopeptide (TPR) repeat protein
MLPRAGAEAILRAHRPPTTRHPHSQDDVPAPESRSPSLASKLLPAAAVLLGVVLLGLKAWSALPRIAELGTSGFRAGTSAPLPPPLTRIDDSIFRPLRVPDRDPFGYPANTVDKREVAALLLRGRYDALDRRLEGLHRQVMDDVRYEYHLLDAFHAFGRTDPEVGARLDEWVRRWPGSPHARMARAMYSLHAGWEARGGKWAMATPREQLERFRELATLAAADARAGLAAEPAHLVGHYVLLDLARAFAPDREIRTLLNEALARHPASYVLRAEYMTSLEPRWGGSYRQMRAFAEESARRTGNPRLATLRGAEHVYRAWQHRRKDDYAAALAEYEQALRHGPEREVLLQRGLTYYRAKDYARAHADLELALQQRPQGPQALEYHGRSLYYLARALPNSVRGTALARADADFGLLAAVDPDNPDVAEWLGHVAEMKRWCAAQPQPCR